MSRVLQDESLDEIMDDLIQRDDDMIGLLELLAVLLGGRNMEGEVDAL